MKGLCALALALSFVALGCENEPYCVNCTTGGAFTDVPAVDVGPRDGRANNDGTTTGDGNVVGDGSGGDGSGGGDGSAGDVPDTGPCTDTQSDPRNCGACGNLCALAHAVPSCAMGVCQIRQCDVGWYDNNRMASDGCEYQCIPTGTTEVCDGMDNDCNGFVDEGFNLDTDVANCGRCGNGCVFNQAEAACVGRTCVMGNCRAGAIDLDRRPDNGCEYACTRTGPEVCDGRDNDCDGMSDNGFNLMTDARNCGACGRACNLPNTVPTCAMGVCGVGACVPGYANRNGDASDGCEWACGDAMTGRTGPEVCDGRDNDCNGMIDEGLMRTCYSGAAGTSGVGACRSGAQTCSSGMWSACIGEVRPSTEVCDGADNNCNGTVDEGLTRACYAGPAGTAGVGACRAGTQTCAGGTFGACTGEVGPGTEVCDGRDNDCDGMTDEGLAPPATLRCNTRGPETQGVCATAMRRCGGAAGWGCDYPMTYRNLADEGYCDTLDNNCDGRVDEGCLTFLTTADLRIDQAAGNSLQPLIAGGGNNLGVVYADRRSGASDIYFARSTTGGASWERDLRVDTGAAGSRDSLQPWISWAGGAGGVLVGWSDYRSPGTDPDYRRVYANVSTTGASFQTADRRVNAIQTDDSFNVRVAQTPAGAVAVWEALLSRSRDRHIYSAFSADRGLTWTSLARVDNAPTSAVASTPRIATGAGNRVYVVWRDNRSGMNQDIYFRSSDNGGMSWGREVRLDTDPAGAHASEEPSVAADAEGNVYVAWQDVRTGDSYDIYFNRSTDHGATWLTTDLRVDTDTFAQDSVRPIALALPGRVAVVVWEDQRFGLPTPYASRGTEAGTRWMTADVPVPAGRPGRFNAYNIAASASGNLVFVAWADDRNGGALDIQGNYSLDGGASYQPADVRLDTSAPGASDSNNPSVLVTGGRVHVVWLDRRADGTTGDIYYRGLR